MTSVNKCAWEVCNSQWWRPILFMLRESWWTRNVRLGGLATWVNSGRWWVTPRVSCCCLLPDVQGLVAFLSITWLVSFWKRWGYPLGMRLPSRAALQGWVDELPSCQLSPVSSCCSHLWTFGETIVWVFLYCVFPLPLIPFCACFILKKSQTCTM